MSKIMISDLTFYYMQYFQPVFEHVSLNLDTDWKLGLIGRNGRGKTTFLNLLTGTLTPVSGLIQMEVNTEFFPYQADRSYQATVDIIKENIGGLRTMELKMEKMIWDSHFGSSECLMKEYQELLTDYMDADGYEMESRIRREFNLMQLPEELLERPYSTLSGGEKTKVQIIVLFLRKNAFILLDEPTNHLDIDGKRTLTAYLQKKNGFIVVSHDRAFLDEVIDHILSINKTSIELEKGNYSSWKANKDTKELFEFRTRARLEKEISALERQSVLKRDWAGEAELTKNDHGRYERSSGSRAAQFMMHAKNAEAEAKENLELKKQLLKNYEVAAELVIGQNRLKDQLLLEAKGLNFGYQEDQLLISDFNLQVFQGDRIWIKGANGTGKSTLLKLLSGHLDSDQRVRHCDHLTIAESFQEPLWQEGLLSDYVEGPKLQRLRELCGRFDLTEETLERPIETFSGGEKKKLDIARALAGNAPLIFLDEPLNFMDVYFREQLEEAILKYEPTIIFVEHEERFGSRVATKIYDFQNAGDI